MQTWKLAHDRHLLQFILSSVSQWQDLCFSMKSYNNICSDKKYSNVRSAASHQRSIIFPRGNQGYRFVEAGNILAARVSLLIVLILTKKARYLLEQPQGSVLSLHPRISWLFSLTVSFTVNIWGGLCAEDPADASAKPHRLWSNDEQVLKEIQIAAGSITKPQLEAFGKRLVQKRKREDGSMGFTGVKSDLKASQ